MGADIDLLMARREAERGMRDKVRVTRSARSSVIDEMTGTYPEVETTIYEGKARIKQPRMTAKNVEAGSQLLVSTSLEVQIPVDSDDLHEGDAVEVIECPDRPRQVGREFTVLGPFDGSQTTALRYRIEASDGRG